MGEKNQNELLEEISTKLDLILGYLAIRGIEDDPAKIVNKLRDLGFNNNAIAPIAGLSVDAVKKRLQRQKKK